MSDYTKNLIACAIKIGKIEFVRRDSTSNKTVISLFGHTIPVYDQKMEHMTPSDIRVNILSDDNFRNTAENAVLNAMSKMNDSPIHDEIVESLIASYIKPDETLHLCVGFYSNGQFKTNTVKGRNLADNIEYNLAMRPGRFYFVDGEYVGGGVLQEPYQTETINKYKARIKDMGLKPANHDTAPYE